MHKKNSVSERKTDVIDVVNTHFVAAPSRAENVSGLPITPAVLGSSVSWNVTVCGPNSGPAGRWLSAPCLRRAHSCQRTQPGRPPPLPGRPTRTGNWPLVKPGRRIQDCRGTCRYHPATCAMEMLPVNSARLYCLYIGRCRTEIVSTA